MKRMQNYISDVIQEMRKVTWPTGEELKASTLTVLLFTFFSAGFVLVVDYVLSLVVKQFLNAG